VLVNSSSHLKLNVEAVRLYVRMICFRFLATFEMKTKTRNF
jgi:hypothetical protein